ncbi:methyltransferase family protein [Nocardia sp. 004]|uniref:methyltransferase family protein n=1 Tax=Nocardia sp. 004 TaxID=3385978 RepID=UPI00399F5F32
MTVAVLATWLWLAYEVGLIVRDKLRGRGSTAHDQRSRATIYVVVIVSVFCAALIGALLPESSPFAFPGPPPLFWQIVGLTLMGLGFALRVWAIAVLGAAFRTTVEVDADQRVVDRGPYRRIRHPSYTGVALITTGFGLACANWISLALATILPVYVLSRRIRIEEQALLETLGEAYRIYCRGTKRLIPWVW